MGINPIGPGNPVTRLQGSKAISSAAGPKDLDRTVADKVETSSATRWLEAVKELPEVRQDKIDAAKAKLAAGVYDDPKILDAALDRLLEEGF